MPILYMLGKGGISVLQTSIFKLEMVRAEMIETGRLSVNRR